MLLDEGESEWEMAESDNRHRIGVDNDWFCDYSDDVSLTEAQVLLRNFIALRYSFAVYSSFSGSI